MISDLFCFQSTWVLDPYTGPVFHWTGLVSFIAYWKFPIRQDRVFVIELSACGVSKKR